MSNDTVFFTWFTILGAGACRRFCSLAPVLGRNFGAAPYAPSCILLSFLPPAALFSTSSDLACHHHLWDPDGFSVVSPSPLPTAPRLFSPNFHHYRWAFFLSRADTFGSSSLFSPERAASESGGKCVTGAFLPQYFSRPLVHVNQLEVTHPLYSGSRCS